MSQVMPVRFRRKALISAIMCVSLPIQALAQESQPIELGAIEVSGERGEPASEATERYTTTSSSTSMKLDLSHRETPQAVTVITREQIDDFALNDVNDVLKNTTGVTVESVETDRTYYTSRGFDINNFQYDGVGMPMAYGNIQGELDTAFYDRVEVLRGSNGLMTGSGNPSATVNFIRKRPTAETQASVAGTVGSWENKRLIGDLSGPMTDSGNVRGRVVAGYQDRESYLDRYQLEKQMFYGVVETDVTATTLLTLGHATQVSNADSPLWGALPLNYTDGTPTDFKRSTSTSSDWSFWDNTQHNSFIELQQDLASGWQATVTGMRIEQDSDSELFYQFGTPDPQTGLGLFAYPSDYELNTEQLIADAYANGPFDLLARTHELVAGATWSRAETEDRSFFSQNVATGNFQPLPPLRDWDGDYPKPALESARSGSDWTDKEIAAYLAARWTVTDRLTAITGVRRTWLDSDGDSYGNTKETSYDAVDAPYAGLIYDINGNHSAYASYTEIFSPQTEVDINEDRLEPLEGETVELGLKSGYFQDRLLSTVAIFRTRENNVAEEDPNTPAGSRFFQAVDGITSKGFEVELAGQLTDNVQLFAGYAFVEIEDADNDRTKHYIPERKANLRGVWQVAEVPGLELGSQVRWQSEITNGDPATFKQGTYTLIDLMASYDFSRNWNATLNARNVTDRKYINSLQWAQAYYGAPASADLTVTWNY
ncbi:TonB-dependent siderophore receptor [Marinobacter sp.]|uniref:TonB-dependent siderophore receptor n=1 Tax=Marinobacter sp. TaxID=50741 RepID=UPI00384C1C6C